MIDPIAPILTCIPVAFFQDLAENIDAAFNRAHRLTQQQFAEPERANMLGQNRHSFCEEGFRKAAQDSGLKAVASHTLPAGGRYSLVISEGVCLIRANVQAHCGTPRSTRFRDTWAALNEFLNPTQLDLLHPVSTPSSDRLCGMVVATANRPGSDPSVPAFLGIGIPRSDLSEWVVLEPIHRMIQRYHDLEAKKFAPRDAEVEVKDRAVPRLKNKQSRDPAD